MEILNKKCISNSGLKVIAVVSMLIDHIAVTFFSDTTLGTIMRIIGRIAFPIYAFLLTEGYLHTKNKIRYGAGLLIFALISEYPWDLLRNSMEMAPKQNVFFTLFLGYVGICIYEKFIEKRVWQIILLGALAIASYFLKADYGVSGFVLIMAMYILRFRELWRAAICTIADTHPASILAFIPIHFYNGERGFIKGKVLKYAFYFFYPVHLLILYLMKINL